MKKSKPTKLNIQNSTGKSTNQNLIPPVPPPPLNLSNGLTNNLTSSNLPMSSTKDIEFEHYEFTTPLNTMELKKCNSSISSSNEYSIDFSPNNKPGSNKFKIDKSRKKCFLNQSNQDTTNCNDKSASEFLSYESADSNCKLSNPNNQTTICLPNSSSTSLSPESSLPDSRLNNIVHNEISNKRIISNNRMLINRKKVFNKSKNCFNQSLILSTPVCSKVNYYQCPMIYHKCLIKKNLLQLEDDKLKLSNKFEFLFFCIGSSINLFNIWRFPYLCYKNNGGTFLIAYFICSIVIGFPLLLIELTLGQYSRLNSVHLFRNLVPIFKGLGSVTVLTSIVTTIYLNLILSWTLIYLYESLKGTLKWKKCDLYSSSNCTNLESIKYTSMINRSSLVISSEDFFNNQIVNKSFADDQLMKINWTLLFALFLTWIILFSFITMNIRNTGRIIYLTICPYLCLFLVFLKCVLLNNAADGLIFYIVPSLNGLKDVNLWSDAAIQVLYSFGLAGGSILTYASHNRFYNPVISYAALVWSINILTSLFISFIMFSILGFYSSMLRRPVGSVLSSGIGLLFIVIPERLANNMSWPILWSIFYFVVLFIVGINTQLSSLEVICTYLDSFMVNNKRSKQILNYLGICILMFLLSFPFLTASDTYLLESVDYYFNGLIYLSIAFMEFIIISYIFGIANFFNLLKMMKCWTPNLLVKSHLIVLVTTICPIALSYLMNISLMQILNIRDNKKLVINQDTDRSEIFTYFTWFYQLFCLSVLIFGAFHYIFIQKSERKLITANSKMHLWIKIRFGFEANSIFRKNSNQNLMRTKSGSKCIISKKHQSNCSLHNYKTEKMFKNKDNILIF